MAKKTKEEMRKMGQLIQKYAREYRKEHPNASKKDYMSAAGKMYKQNHSK